MPPVVFKSSILRLSNVAQVASRGIKVATPAIQSFARTLTKEIAQHQFIPTVITMYEDGMDLHGKLVKNTASLSQWIRKSDVYRLTLTGNREEEKSLKQGIEQIFGAIIQNVDRKELYEILTNLPYVKKWERLPISQLTKILTDPTQSRPQQANAIHLLMKRDKAVEIFIKILKKSKDYYVQRGVVSALGEIGSKAAILCLIQVFKDPKQDYRVRQKAEAALLRIGKPVIPHLTPLLKDENYWTRRGAEVVLEYIKGDLL